MATQSTHGLFFQRTTPSRHMVPHNHLQHQFQGIEGLRGHAGKTPIYIQLLKTGAGERWLSS